MIGFQHQAPLKSLTTHSSLTMLLRTLYRMGLNYCLLPPTGDYAYVIVFTKEQLVSLIERSSSEMYIAEIPKHVTQGFFKPVAVFKPDSSSGDLVSEGDFAEPELLQVLVIGENGAQAASLKEALAPRIPDFPEWWEAPVPFAMCGYGTLHLNRTAMLMFGPDLECMPVGDIPEKNEFLVTLEGGESHCSVAFHRIEGDIFVLEDSTSDITAAEEVAWWAAIGKAWVAALDLEHRTYRRCDAEEAERFRSEKNMVLTCEWGGELLGYFCVGDKAETPRAPKTERRAEKTAPTPAARSARADTAKKNTLKDKRSDKNIKPDEKAGTVEPPENEVLKALGPQTLGLLTPGMTFTAVEERQLPEEKNGLENELENARRKKRPVRNLNLNKDKSQR